MIVRANTIHLREPKVQSLIHSFGAAIRDQLLDQLFDQLLDQGFDQLLDQHTCQSFGGISAHANPMQMIISRVLGRPQAFCVLPTA